MNKIYHVTLVPPPISSAHDSYFDETLNDIVYTKLRCTFCTMYMDQNHISVAEYRYLDLPPPTPDNFIPSANVDFRVFRTWVNNLMDVVSIQKELTAKLELKLAATNT